MEWRSFLDLSNAQHLALDSLDPDDALAIACQVLDVDFVPPAVARLIRDKAEGHPLFTEELALSIRDMGVISVGRDDRIVEYDRKALAEFTAPDTLQGLVAARLEHLNFESLFTAKVAALVGRTFAVADVIAVHPNADGELVQEHLAAMEQLRIIQPAGPGYEFRHAIISDVIYGLIPVTQRRELHIRAAEHYEHADDERAVYVLAHHWRLGNVADRAAAATERAGDRSVEVGAFREAADLYTDSLAVGGEQTTALQRARLRRKLGRAYLGLSDLPQSHRELLKALAELDAPLPKGMRIGASIGAAASAQLAHMVAANAFIHKDTDKAQRSAELAEIYFGLGSTTFLFDDAPAFFYVGLAGLNQAERVGKPRSLALASSFGMYVAGVVGLRKRATAYHETSIEAADRSLDPSVQAEVRYNRAGFLGTVGEWQQAADLNARALELYSEVGNQRGIRNTGSLIGYHAHLRGLTAESREHYETVFDLSVRFDDALNRAQAALWIANMDLRAGRSLPAMNAVESVKVDLSGAVGRPGTLQRSAVLAVASHRLGRDTAPRHLAAAMTVLRSASSLTAPHTYDSYLLLAEYLVESEGDVSTLVELEKIARRFSQVVKISTPLVYWIKGHIAAGNGKTQHAQKAWATSAESAVSYGLPYEEALARTDLEQWDRASALADQLGIAHLRQRISESRTQP